MLLAEVPLQASENVRIFLGRDWCYHGRGARRHRTQRLADRDSLYERCLAENARLSKRVSRPYQRVDARSRPKDVASELRNLRNFDLGAAVERHIDPEGDLRHALDPVTDATSSPQTGVMTDDEHLSLNEAVDDTITTAVPAGLPDFIPPAAARQRQIPAFVPPGTRIW